MNHLDSEIVQIAQRVAGELLAEIDGARAVVIATTDGFDVAHEARVSIDPTRLAALVSSVAAIGDAASIETGIGTVRCLVIEASEGRLMVRRIDVLRAPLVVVILTEASVLLGRVWNALNALEKRIGMP